MAAFAHTKLEAGEMMVVGPVTFSSTGSLSFGAGGKQRAQVGRTSERRVGITNRRVIIEQGGQASETQVIMNADVKRVYVRREKAAVKIEKIETTGGQTVKLNISGPRALVEARLFEIFAQAEIGEQRGLLGRFVKTSPQPVAAPRTPTSPEPKTRKSTPAAARPTPTATGWSSSGRSHIDDADIRTVEDLRRYYPLPAEYDYEQTTDGELVVKRLSDGARFPFLLEEELLGFDVPVQDPKRRKVTIEVFKQK